MHHLITALLKKIGLHVIHKTDKPDHTSVRVSMPLHQRVGMRIFIVCEWVLPVLSCCNAVLFPVELLMF